MRCKVTQRHPKHDVPARRESEYVSDKSWQGGGYFEFESDSSGCSHIKMSLKEVKRHKRYYELIIDN